MSKSKKSKEEKASPKKEMSRQVTDQLKTSLDGILKQLLGEKKFENRIRKATRLLTDGIKLKTPAEPKPVKEKTVAKKKEKKEKAPEQPEAVG